MFQRLVNRRLLTPHSDPDKSATLVAVLTKTEIEAVMCQWLAQWAEAKQSELEISQNKLAKKTDIASPDITNAKQLEGNFTTLMMAKIAASVGPRVSVIFGQIAELMAKAELQKALGKPVVEAPVEMPGRKAGARAKALTSAARPKVGKPGRPDAPSTSPEQKQQPGQDHPRTSPK
jgi:hypothetical protein